MDSLPFLESNSKICEEARRIITAEILALSSIRLQRPFAQAVRMIAGCQGRIVTSGIGKSGLVAQRIAATFTVSGTPAFFLHPVEALHGDVGRVQGRADILLLVSKSGETDELLGLMNYSKRWQTPTILITSNPDAFLSRIADCVVLHPEEEACVYGLTPTSSVTCASVIGDALALVLQRVKGFTPQQFQALHNGGKLGQDLELVAAPAPDYST